MINKWEKIGKKTLGINGLTRVEKKCTKLCSLQKYLMRIWGGMEFKAKALERIEVSTPNTWNNSLVNQLKISESVTFPAAFRRNRSELIRLDSRKHRP